MRSKLSILFICAIFISGCVQAPTDPGNPNDPNRKIKIGFAMDTVKEERWQRDRDAFEAAL